MAYDFSNAAPEDLPTALGWALELQNWVDANDVATAIITNKEYYRGIAINDNKYNNTVPNSAMFCIQVFLETLTGSYYQYQKEFKAYDNDISELYDIEITTPTGGSFKSCRAFWMESPYFKEKLVHPQVHSIEIEADYGEVKKFVDLVNGTDNNSDSLSFYEIAKKYEMKKVHDFIVPKLLNNDTNSLCKVYKFLQRTEKQNDIYLYVQFVRQLYMHGQPADPNDWRNYINMSKIQAMCLSLCLKATRLLDFNILYVTEDKIVIHFSPFSKTLTFNAMDSLNIRLVQTVQHLLQKFIAILFTLLINLFCPFFFSPYKEDTLCKKEECMYFRHFPRV